MAKMKKRVLSAPLRRSARLKENSKPFNVKANNDLSTTATIAKKKKTGSPLCYASYEQRILNQNPSYKIVVGVDEAGRGPLAGPVVAAACYVPSSVAASITGVQDSKKLNEDQREELFHTLTTHPDILYRVHVNPAARIDEINILQASLESMAIATSDFPKKVDFAFVDGNKMPAWKNPSQNAQFVIKGDSKVYSIAAASIIAKVTRDRLMLQFHKEFPEYNFAQHKGYPTRAHVAAISKNGPCKIHRMTFAPLKHL